MKKIILAAIVLAAMTTTAHARCNCICVNNEKQLICENSWDVPIGFCNEGMWCSGNF